MCQLSDRYSQSITSLDLLTPSTFVTFEAMNLLVRFPLLSSLAIHGTPQENIARSLTSLTSLTLGSLPDFDDPILTYYRSLRHIQFGNNDGQYEMNRGLCPPLPTKLQSCVICMPKRFANINDYLRQLSFCKSLTSLSYTELTVNDYKYGTCGVNKFVRTVTKVLNII
jgi:hypothetical protein